MSNAGIVVYVILAIICVTVICIWMYRLFRKRSKANIPGEIPTDDEDTSFEEFSEDIEDKVHEGERTHKKGEIEIKLGSGKYQCLCFRSIKGMLVADFTRINIPVGELYQFDTSCPVTGNGYIVKQDNEVDLKRSRDQQGAP